MTELESAPEDVGTLSEGQLRRQSVAVQVNNVSSVQSDSRKDAWSILGGKNAKFLAIVLSASLAFGFICTMVTFNFDFFQVSYFPVVAGTRFCLTLSFSLIAIIQQQNLFAQTLHGFPPHKRL